MIFDVNAWIGTCPFSSSAGTSPQGLLQIMNDNGISTAAVSPMEAIFCRNVQPANEQFAQTLAPFSERLLPMATINPTYYKWEDDLRVCHEKLNMRGVRLFPQYHDYAPAGPEAQRVLAACRERGLPVAILHRMEDPRQRHPMDSGKTVVYDDIAALMKAEPGATVILLNVRGSVVQSQLMQPAVRDQNWYIDLALAEVHYHRDVKDLIEQTGVQHLLFGTHSPISYAACALLKYSLLPITDAQRAEVGYMRAERLFNWRDSDVRR